MHHSYRIDLAALAGLRRDDAKPQLPSRSRGHDGHCRINRFQLQPDRQFSVSFHRRRKPPTIRTSPALRGIHLIHRVVSYLLRHHKKSVPAKGHHTRTHNLSPSTTPGFRSASHIRQVCTSINTCRRVSHSSGHRAGCQPPPYQEELPVLDGSYCDLERDRAPLPAPGPLGLRLSAFPAPRFQSESGTRQAHPHALTDRTEPG